MTKSDKVRRLDWAKKFFSWKTEWDNVIFSDEKKFNLYGPDGYSHYWHDLRKEERIFSKRHSCHKSLMIWIGFSSKGKTEIAYLSGRANSTRYVETLKDCLLPAALRLAGKNWIFQRDNAPIHRSKETNEWCQKKNINVLEWPAYSPDMNPTENIFGILARRVYMNNRQYDDVDQLKSSIEKEWKALETEFLQKLVDSMPNRLFELTKANGSWTHY